MSDIRFGGGREYQFFRREDIRVRWDLPSAVQFLNSYRGDARAMGHFRQEVAKRTFTKADDLSAEQIIQSMARMLAAGEFVVLLPQRIRHRDPIDLGKPAPAPSGPRDPKPVEVIEDDPTFESNHDGVKQAAALIAAAESAYPFCEECARQAELQGAGR